MTWRPVELTARERVAYLAGAVCFGVLFAAMKLFLGDPVSEAGSMGIIVALLWFAIYNLFGDPSDPVRSQPREHRQMLRRVLSSGDARSLSPVQVTAGLRFLEDLDSVRQRQRGALGYLILGAVAVAGVALGVVLLISGEISFGIGALALLASMSAYVVYEKRRDSLGHRISKARESLVRRQAQLDQRPEV